MRIRRLVAATCVCCLAVTTAAAQVSDGSIAVAPAASTIPMIWRARLLTDAGALTIAATSKGARAMWPSGFGAPSPRGRSLRAVKLALFDVPTAAYFVSFNHETGHLFRAADNGIGATLRLTGGPWSAEPFYLEPDLNYPAIDGGPRYNMAVEGGGLEASWLLKDEAESTYLVHDRVPAGTALMATLASLDTPMYALLNLSDASMRERWGHEPGDLLAYMEHLYRLRGSYCCPESLAPNAPSYRGVSRGRALWNLADAAMATAVVGIMRDYFWNGADSIRIRALTIGGVRLLPAVRYAFTPLGPEFAIRTQYRLGRHAGSSYVRWTERGGPRVQTGAGFSWSRNVRSSLRPGIAADVWSQGRAGGRIEFGLDVQPGRERVTWVGRAGYKSAGYLQGFPVKATAYGTVGLNLRLW